MHKTRTWCKRKNVFHDGYTFSHDGYTPSSTGVFSRPVYFPGRANFTTTCAPFPRRAYSFLDRCTCSSTSVPSRPQRGNRWLAIKLQPYFCFPPRARTQQPLVITQSMCKASTHASMHAGPSPIYLSRSLRFACHRSKHLPR